MEPLHVQKHAKQIHNGLSRTNVFYSSNVQSLCFLVDEIARQRLVIKTKDEKISAMLKRIRQLEAINGLKEHELP